MRTAAAILGILLMTALGGEPALRPFFDTVDQGVLDPAPPPPVITPFERAMLDLCGDWGSRPDGAAFVALLQRFPAHRDALYAAFGAADDDGLRRLWFRHDGLAHVLCGEPGRKRLGGLHWRARYRQAQQEGWAGRMTAAECDRTEIAPPVYTVGTRYRRPDGGIGEKCPNGYAVSEGALDILADTTSAVRAAGFPRARTVCLGEGRDGDRVFPLVVVIEDGAVITSYPDASPAPHLSRCGR